MANMRNRAFQMNTTRIGKDYSFRRLLAARNWFGKHIVIGRYYIAAMLLILNIISAWRLFNITLSFFYAEYDYHFFTPVVQNWTDEDHRTFRYGILGGQICVQIPAALLIYLTSSHKFLTAAVAISSASHMLMPMVENLHFSCLMILLCAQYIAEAPLRIAVLSIWRDWAPPGRQTIFVFISFSSLILGLHIIFSMDSLKNAVPEQGSFYLSGACGLLWSLVWFLTVSDTPGSNLQCSQNEQSCLQNITLPAATTRLKIKEVPWIRILTAKPVFALCLIYYKLGGSSYILHNVSITFGIILDLIGYISLISFRTILAVLYAVILFSSAITIDFFSRKYPRKINIKKGIFCTVLIIHGIFLLGTLYQHVIMQTIILCISYFIFAISIPGFITNALELSTKYVAIIGGFIETFYHLGLLVSQYYMTEIHDYLYKQPVLENQEGKRLLYEVAVAIFVAVIFLIWGSVVEQPWSMNTASRLTSANTEAHITSEEHELSAAPSNIFELCETGV